MEEGEEWKNPDVPSGDCDTPLSVSSSSGCGLIHCGLAGRRCLPASSPVGTQGTEYTAQQEQGGYSQSSWFSNETFLTPHLISEQMSKPQASKKEE